VRDLLRDASRTALVLVTLAEDMPTTETRELARANDRLLKVPLGALVVNGLWPDGFETDPDQREIFRALERAGGAGSDPVLAPLCVRAHTAQERRRLNDRCLDRLAIEVPAPQLHLPYLFRPRFGAAELGELSETLGRQLDALVAEDAA
jgi:hypothetical protein